MCRKTIYKQYINNIINMATMTTAMDDIIIPKESKWQLLEWIDIKKLDWRELSRNPNAIDLLFANPDKVDWKRRFSSNPNAIDYLTKNPDKISKFGLYDNPNIKAIDLICPDKEKQVDRFSGLLTWFSISSNPDAVDLILEIVKKYNGRMNDISSNPNPIIIELLKKNLDKINWTNLSSNPSAMELLMANPSKINYATLCKNPNPDAIDFLLANPDHKWCWENLSSNTCQKAIDLLTANQSKIEWKILSSNPSAMDLLMANQHKIYWEEFSSNPSIFYLIQ